MRGVLGLAFFGLGSAFGAPAHAQPPAIVGAWTCDPFENVREEEGATSKIYGKPVFNADGTYSEQVTGAMEMLGRVLNVRSVISGRWRLDEPGDRLRYEIEQTAVHEVILDGKVLDPATFEGSFASAMTKPYATTVRVEEDTLWLEWDDISLPCRRTPAGALS